MFAFLKYVFADLVDFFIAHLFTDNIFLFQESQKPQS